jgi:hypothetical protein
MKSISETYADFIVRTRFEDLGAEVVQQAKKLILDLVGVSLAPATMGFQDRGGYLRVRRDQATILRQEEVSGGERGLANASFMPWTWTTATVLLHHIRALS